MSVLPFKEIYGYETDNFEEFLDLVYKKEKILLRYYIKKNNVSQEDINKMIDTLVISFNFVLDRSRADRTELIDVQTGKTRFYVWNDGMVEYCFME
jgi:hypothetical protein